MAALPGPRARHSPYIYHRMAPAEWPGHVLLLLLVLQLQLLLPRHPLYPHEPSCARLPEHARPRQSVGCCYEATEAVSTHHGVSGKRPSVQPSAQRKLPKARARPDALLLPLAQAAAGWLRPRSAVAHFGLRRSPCPPGSRPRPALPRHAQLLKAVREEA